jgi:hypothetical protein
MTMHEALDRYADYAGLCSGLGLGTGDCVSAKIHIFKMVPTLERGVVANVTFGLAAGCFAVAVCGGESSRLRCEANVNFGRAKVNFGDSLTRPANDVRGQGARLGCDYDQIFKEPVADIAVASY